MCSPVATPAGVAPGPPEIAEVFRQFAHELTGLTAPQAKVARAIMDCRTAALGGHVRQCEQCGHRQVHYNSCRNRHCPKCQALAQARWLQARQADLLPVEYFHVVFTVPDVLHPLFIAAPGLCYDLLMRSAAATLQEVALNPRHLGARIGVTAVLHTWTQTLLLHPHTHCVVPGGGLSVDGTRWVSCRPGFLLPVRVLSVVFRGKLLSALEAAVNEHRLQGTHDDPRALLRRAARKSWVVYSKPPFGGPEQILRYVGRYTHRIAISNSRLVSITGREVTFRWKDRADGNKDKLMTLDAAAFLRRFLMHVVPKGFMRVRHYGLLANAGRKDAIASCRKLLAAATPSGEVASDPEPPTWQQLLQRLTGLDPTLCPVCGQGPMLPVEDIARTPNPWSMPARATSP